MSTTDTTPAYAVLAAANRNIFGKRSEGFRGVLTGRYGSPVVEVNAPTMVQAKKDVLETVAECVDQINAITIAFCGDGETVLILRRGLYGWAYDITGPKRTTRTGCLMSTQDRTEAERSMLAHADQSYGGTLQVVR